MSFYTRLIATMQLSETELKTRQNTGLTDAELWGLTQGEEPQAIYSHPDYFARMLTFLKESILSKQPLVIYGDYDVDGLTATSIMLIGLRLLGLGAQTGFYIPSRYDTGYGLNAKILQLMVKKGYQTLIAVDNGITKKSECAYLASKGVKYVILDHHEAQKGSLPNLDAPLGVLYHRNECSAAYLALVTVQKLLTDESFVAACQKAGLKVADAMTIEAFMGYLITLAGLAVFSDCMSLANPVNLALAKRGLGHLNEGLKKAGPAQAYFARLTQLVTNYHAPQVLTYHDINFQINSKLNAVARVWGGNKTNIGVHFLTGTDEEQVNGWAAQIKKANEEKKQLVKNASIVPTDEASPLAILDYSTTKVPSGLSGLIANATLDNLAIKKPVVVLCVSQINPSEVIGSLRGPEGLSLDKVLTSPYIKPFLKDHGGHEAACGFTLPSALKEPFLQALTAEIRNKGAANKGRLEMALEESWLTGEALQDLARLEPFGTGFECPLFTLTLDRQRLLKNARGNHLFYPLATGGRVVLFNALPVVSNLTAPTIECIGTLSENSYGGKHECQLVAKPRNSQ